MSNRIYKVDFGDAMPPTERAAVLNYIRDELGCQASPRLDITSGMKYIIVFWYHSNDFQSFVKLPYNCAITEITGQSVMEYLQ